MGEMNDRNGQRVQVEQTVTVRDAEGKAAYELTAKAEGVQVRQKRISFSAPTVRVEDLREALDALYALGRD